LQNWHLYFFSGTALEVLRLAMGEDEVELAGMAAAAAAAGIAIRTAVEAGTRLRTNGH